MATSLPQFAEFVTSEDATFGEHWETWLESLQYLLIGLDLEEIEPDPGKTLSDKEKVNNKRILKRKRALRLYYGGNDVQKLFSCLPAEKGGPEDYATAVTALSEIFNTGQRTELQEFEFRSLKQEPGEAIDAYASRLRRKAKHCNFAYVDKELKSQLIQCTTSSRLRRRAIREALDLTNIIKAGRAYEASERAAKLIEGDKTKEVNKIKHMHKQKKNAQKNEKQCYKCGESSPHRDKCHAISHNARSAEKMDTLKNVV